MCFHIYLKKCRTDKGISQKDLAAMIGVAPSTYSQYESGVREPDVMKIKKIAKALKVTGDYLLFGTDSPFQEENNNKTEYEILYSQLDDIDRAEIRGEMKQMLKADKYNQGNTVTTMKKVG